MIVIASALVGFAFPAPGIGHAGTDEKDGFTLAIPGKILPTPTMIAPETEIVLAAVGDVIPHDPVQKFADNAPLGYRSGLSRIEPFFDAADIVYANLETPIAPGLLPGGRSAAKPVSHYDGYQFSGYPQFNALPRLAFDLKAAGVDIVSTANNHALDRGALGIDLTLDVLERAQLRAVGSRRHLDRSTPWHTITEVRGRRLAWLSCTYSTNGIEDTFGQTLRCFRDQKFITEEIANLARRPDIAAVIVTPHFGLEYSPEPTIAQIRFAREAIEAGALLVLGSHPHVVQPWEWYRATDGHIGFIIYSLGNFISNQVDLITRSGIILFASMGKTATGRIGLSGIRYLPIHTTKSLDAAGNPAYSVEPAIGEAIGAETVALLERSLGSQDRLKQPDPIETHLIAPQGAFEGLAGTWTPPDEPPIQAEGAAAPTVMALDLPPEGQEDAALDPGAPPAEGPAGPVILVAGGDSSLAALPPAQQSDNIDARQ